jgi:hypothetical protein
LILWWNVDHFASATARKVPSQFVSSTEPMNLPSKIDIELGYIHDWFE